MYGFIEKYLADILEVPHEEFGLNDGNMAAILDKPIFEKVLRSLILIWEECHDDALLKPQAIRSDVVGAKLLFHKYWANDEVLNGLTDGPTKSMPEMMFLFNISRPRFIPEEFKSRIKQIYDNIDSQQEVSEQNEEVNIESEATPNTVPDEAVVNEPTEEEKFLEFFEEKYSGRIVYKHRTPGRKFCFAMGSGQLPESHTIDKMADGINKNIIVFSMKIRASEISIIKRNFKYSEIEKHTMLVFLKPCESNGFYRPHITNGLSPTKVSCFGEEIYSPYILQIRGDIRISIESDPTINESEVNNRMDSLLRNPSLSIYAKYDTIFKDTCTNFVWALRDRCFLYFTFSPLGSNEIVFNKCVKELSRRFDKSISSEELRRIDRKYQEEIKHRNEEEYISFAVKSANSMMDELKEEFTTKKFEYHKYLDKAMEYGKIMERLSDQIEAFDMEKYESKQREKALSGYEETLKIPEVLSINVREDVINVYTKNLYAQDDRSEKWHDIGTFHIQIGMMFSEYNQERTVKIMNTKHQISGLNENMQAPHVFSEGKICHGSLATGMVEAYKRRDLFSLAYQLIIFLQNANTDDSAGKYIDRWPEVPKEVATGELSVEELDNEEPNEAELAFDSMLSEAIPVHI